MSQPANVFNIRWLVERAVDLQAPPGHVPAFLVDTGVPASQTYTLKDGTRFRLPTFEDGVRHLVADIRAAQSPEGMDKSRAVYSLLANPTFVAPLRVPDYADLLALGVGVSEGRVKDVQRLGLAVVIRPVGEALQDGYLSAPRTGGIARLTVLRSSSGTSASDAWVDISWAGSAPAFSQLLEALHAEMHMAPVLDSKAAALVISRDLDPVMTAEVVADLARVFAVHSLRVDVFRTATVPANSIRAKLKSHPRSVVVGVGSSPELQDLYVPPTSGNWRAFEIPEFDGLRETVRERMCGFSLVSAGLLPLGSAASPVALARKPISHPGECLHDHLERAYVEDLDTDLWWTHDTAGHAGSVFKTYRKVDQTLVHEACRDAAGVKIEKWKGDVGRTIRLDALHGCGSKAPHL